MWPIILKNCSMLGDAYKAQKNASIIYLGLVWKKISFCVCILIIIIIVTGHATIVPAATSTRKIRNVWISNIEILSVIKKK